MIYGIPQQFELYGAISNTTSQLVPASFMLRDDDKDVWLQDLLMLGFGHMVDITLWGDSFVHHDAVGHVLPSNNKTKPVLGHELLKQLQASEHTHFQWRIDPVNDTHHVFHGDFYYEENLSYLYDETEGVRWDSDVWFNMFQGEHIRMWVKPEGMKLRVIYTGIISNEKQQPFDSWLTFQHRYKDFDCKRMTVAIEKTVW